jgi:hypothetical protein
MTDRYVAVVEGRITGNIINAPPALKAFMDARARGASRPELLRLRLAAQITPARAARMEPKFQQEDK